MYAEGFYAKPEITCLIGEVESVGVYSEIFTGDIRFPAADSTVVCTVPAAACTPLPCSAPVRISLNGKPSTLKPQP